MPLGSLQGDTDKLGRLRGGLQRLGSEGYKQTLALVAARAGGLIDRGFTSSSDPYGAPWAPTVAGNKPLIKTGALHAAAVRVTPTATGIKVHIPLSYAGFHLTGTSRMPARPYLPAEDFSRLPPAWRSMVEGAMGSILTIYLPS